MALHFSKNPNLSLREKLRLSYEEGKTSHRIDDAMRDKAGQYFAIIGLVNVAFLDMFIVNPVLYQDSDIWTKVAVQGFGCVCVFEILVNWLCMKYVGSSYAPSIHGAKPPNLALGERVVNTPVTLDSHAPVSDPTDQDSGLFDMSTMHEGATGSQGIKMRRDVTETKPNVMYVVNAIPEREGEPLKRTKYPYFSWTQCLMCNRPRPPRCHHCPICKRCVLRRDHHCFFSGNCIGYRNLRYFTTFLIWVAIASVYLWCNLWPYCQYHLMSHISVADLVLPVAVVRAMLGYIAFKSLYIISVSYFSAMFVFLMVKFLPMSLVCVVTGTTSFEREHRLNIVDTRNVLDKVRSVFGYYWFLNVLLPLHFWFEPVEDPVTWSSIKA